MGQTSGLSRAVDVGSAGLFAGAAGFSALLLASPAAGVAAAAIAFVGAHRTLGRIDDAPRFALQKFEVGAIEAEDELLLTELTELLLTDVYAEGEEGELLLDDPLAVPSEDSRVIRLFDPRLLPTAGELSERIEKHLKHPKGASYPDATNELHQALAALRGSLR